MQRILLTCLALILTFTLACSEQRASEHRDQNAQADDQVRDSAQKSDQDVEDSRSTGEKIGEKAREAEVRTRDEREQIKQGARKVGDKLAAAAEGVKAGWGTSKDAINLNSASRTQLEELAGLSGQDADRIIANRPYSSKRDLVDKKVLSEAKYTLIAERVTVN